MGISTRPALHDGNLKTELTMTGVLGHFIIWLLISVITLGVGLFFWPYAAAKLILNATEIQDSNGLRVGRLECSISAGTQIGHIVLWLLLTVITFGIAYPFYIFGVARTAINETRIV